MATLDELITPRNIAIAGVGAGALTAVVLRRYGGDILGQEISTEKAVSAVALIGGVGGGIAQLLTGARLSGVEGDTVPVKSLILPISLMIVGSSVGAFTLPNE